MRALRCCRRLHAPGPDFQPLPRRTVEHFAEYTRAQKPLASLGVSAAGLGVAGFLSSPANPLAEYALTPLALDGEAFLASLLLSVTFLAGQSVGLLPKSLPRYLPRTLPPSLSVPTASPASFAEAEYWRRGLWWRVALPRSGSFVHLAADSVAPSFKVAFVANAAVGVVVAAASVTPLSLPVTLPAVLFVALSCRIHPFPISATRHRVTDTIFALASLLLSFTLGSFGVALVAVWLYRAITIAKAMSTPLAGVAGRKITTTVDGDRVVAYATAASAQIPTLPPTPCVDAVARSVSFAVAEYVGRRMYDTAKALGRPVRRNPLTPSSQAQPVSYRGEDDEDDAEKQRAALIAPPTVTLDPALLDVQPWYVKLAAKTLTRGIDIYTIVDPRAADAPSAGQTVGGAGVVGAGGGASPPFPPAATQTVAQPTSSTPAFGSGVGRPSARIPGMSEVDGSGNLERSLLTSRPAAGSGRVSVVSQSDWVARPTGLSLSREVEEDVRAAGFEPPLKDGGDSVWRAWKVEARAAQFLPASVIRMIPQLRHMVDAGARSTAPKGQ